MAVKLHYGGVRSADLFYQNKHHIDPVYNKNHLEKLYVWNDECDGLVWEKEHSKDCIISITSYYPGFYMSSSYPTTMIHPKDSIYPYVSNGGRINDNNYTGASLTRTKDFVICRFPTYFSSYTGLRWSNDGVHWTKWVGGLPSGMGGWSTKENAAIYYGVFSDDPNRENAVWKLEIDSSGKTTRTKLGTIGQGDFATISGPICDLLGLGMTQDGNHTWFKFVNLNGDVYTSALPGRYQYTDMRESDPAARVKWADYNWNIKYLNDKYYAASMKTDTIYWNEVLQQWQTSRSFIVVESSDGFKHITTHYVMSPCPDICYQSWDYWYFNGRFIILELGKENAQDPEQYFKIRDINNNVLGTVIEKVQMPFVGMAKDGSYDSLTFRFRGTEAEVNRNCVRSFGWGFESAVYIKDGAPAEPYGSLIWGTAFCKNGWSSNSYDDGGFIFMQVGDTDPFVTRQPEKAIAYRSANQMIDRDNATWGIDKYHIKIKGPANADVRIQELNSSYNPHSYNVQLSENGLYINHLNFYIGKSVKVTVLGEHPKELTITLHHELNTFNLDPSDIYRMNSEFYFEEMDMFTSFGGRDFYRTEGGPSYCFAVYTGNGWTHPLVVCDDKFCTDYSPGNGNLGFVEYNGITWYYRGFEYSMGGNYTDAVRYIDSTPCGSSVANDIVKYCLMKVYGEI